MDLTKSLIELADEYNIPVFEENYYPPKSAFGSKDSHLTTYESHDPNDPASKVMIKKFQRVVESNILGMYSKQQEIVKERMWKYFKRECRIWNCDGIDHPNIIKFRGVMKQPENQLPAYVTQLASLGDLNRYISAGHSSSLNLGTKMKLMCDVAEGLSFLHKRGVVHRDVKASNILLDREPDGTIKALLSDFGSAKDLAGVIPNYCSTNITTLRYCSPEQLRSPNEISSAKDIWSFGCVLLELVNNAIGLWPINYSKETVSQCLVNGEHPPRPRNMDETDIIWIFVEACCWCGKPEDRVTAKEAANELKQIA